MQRIIILLVLVCMGHVAIAQRANNKMEVKKQEEVKHMKVYPTEADKYVNVYVEFEQPSDIVITLVGSTQNYESVWEAKAITSHQQTIDVTKLNNGTYLVRLAAGKVKEEAAFSVKR